MPKINAFETNPTVIRRLQHNAAEAPDRPTRRNDDRYKDHRRRRSGLRHAREAFGLLFVAGDEGLAQTPLVKLSHYRI